LASLLLLAVLGLVGSFAAACGDDDDAEPASSAPAASSEAAAPATSEAAAPSSSEAAPASSEAVESSAEAPSSSEAPAESSAAAPAVEGGPLKVWLGGILATATPGSPARQGYDDQVKAFEEAYPGTKVETTLMDPDGVKQTAAWRAAFGAGDVPDVGMMYPGGFATTFASSLANLREVAPDAVAAFSEGQLAYGCEHFDCSNDAPVYLVPHDFSGWVLAYNKEIFDEVGITAPFASWDDLVAAGQKLKDAGYVPFQMGNRDGYISDAYLSAMYSSFLTSQDVVGLLSGAVKFTDPRIVEPLKVWAQLYADGLTNKNACSLETLASQRDFVAGKAATVATFDYTNIYAEMGDKMGVMTFPPITSGPLAADAGAAAQVGEGWVVTKDAENAPLAAAFVTQVTNAASQSADFSIAGQPPANAEADLSTPPNPAAAAASQLFLDYAILSLNTVLPLETQVGYFKETAQALCGRKSPEDAMQAVQEIFDKETGG
jgi:ABC-type glycerol-3-phosphate transport system substrate-binding protein